MLVPWPREQCILCDSTCSQSEEHIIPEVIGGKLSAKFLCKMCNDELGHRVDYTAKTDPSIRLAANNLQNQLPDLARNHNEDQRYIGHGKGPPVGGSIKNGTWKAKYTKLKDGSVIQSEGEARKRIEKDQGAEALRRFDAAPLNTVFEISPGRRIARWTTERIEPDLRTERLNPLLPVKIAFEFLALHLGTAIYPQAPQMQEIKDALRGRCDMVPFIEVENLHAAKYDPFHGIAFMGNEPHAIVLVRLFGRLVYRVHFKRLAVGGPQYVYTHRLDDGSEDFSERASGD
jgi:hypothetical protein